MMYDRIPSEEDVKMRAEREMDMTTDLLAGASVEEPRIFSIRSGILLKSYLIICTMLNLFTMLAVSGRLKAFYLAKSMFTAFGFYSMTRKSKVSSKPNMIFTGLFGASVLAEAVPCVAGIIVLFSRDVCSVLAGIGSGNSSVDSSEEFMKFCQRNLESVRFLGTSVIVTELLLDSLVFLQLVQYQKYLKMLEIERASLNYYTGKERIAIP